MKKLFLNCIALSAFVATPAFAGMMAPESNNAQIATAFEKGLLFSGFNTTEMLKVDKTKTGFAVKIPATSMGTGKNIHKFPAATVALTRTDDFGSFAQYQMKDTTIPYLRAIFATMYPNGTFSIAKSVEDIEWVPALKLRTKQSVKTENLKMDTGEGVLFSLAQGYFDTLIGNKGNRMDMASSIETHDITIQSGMFSIIIPRIFASSQTLGSEQNADPIQQFLSAAVSRADMTIPELTLTASTPLFQPIKLKAELSMESVQDPRTGNMMISFRSDKNILNLSDDDFKKGILPASFPQNIRVNVTLAGINASEIRNILNMQEQLNEIPDEESTEFAQKNIDLQTQMQTIMAKTRLNINTISVENPVAAIHFTGNAQMVNGAPQFNGSLAITNFDLISPDYATKCESDKKTQAREISALPMSCMQFGVFDVLRPYLKDAKKSVDAQNRPVHLFALKLSDGQISINDQPFQPIIAEDVAVIEMTEPAPTPVAKPMPKTPAKKPAAKKGK